MAAVLAASALAFSAGPAFAGACAGTSANAPDARARVGGGPFSGSGVYANEQAQTDLSPGQVVTIAAQWKNVSNAVQTIRVRSYQFSKDDGIRVKLFVDGVNVTSRFRGENPGLTFKNLAPGKRTSIIDVQFRNIHASGHPYAQQPLFGYYKGAPTTNNCDAVFAKVNQL
jgi:hypothetical protein